MNNANTFIAAAEDGPPTHIEPPRGKRAIAEIQYEMLVETPYRFTEEDILFASSSPVRQDPSKQGDKTLREQFFAKPQACLRCSPLVKKWGWGIHLDQNGKAAAFAKDSEEYALLTQNPSLTQAKGMRTKRG